MRKGIPLLLCSLFLSALGYGQAKPFKKGDRVVFTGNSITDGGHYHSYVWLYYMTHFPADRIDVFNAGIGGDVARQIWQRLDDDVFSHDPTVITLTFGMNDTGYGDFLTPKADSIAAARIDTSRYWFEKIEGRLKAKPAITKIMMASSPYDETVKMPRNYFPGKSKAMEKVLAFQQDAAKQNGWGFVDFNHPVTKINQEWQQRDTAFTLCGQDRVHPGNDGHMVMAYVFLKAQGLSGKPVADILINAKSAKVARSENVSISDFHAGDNTVSFHYLGKSLPYPTDSIPRGWNEKKSQQDGLKYVPFTEEFNQEKLTVSDLEPATKYSVTIDSVPVGAWSGEDLSKGINLAVLTTNPEYKQAAALMYLNEERWEIERRLRVYYWLQFSFFRDKGVMFRDDDVAMDTLDANLAKNIFLGGSRDMYLKARNPAIRQVWKEEMAMLTDRIYRLNQPRRHLLKISRSLQP